MMACMLFPAELLAQDRDSVVQLPAVTVTAIARVNRDVSDAFKKAFPDAKKLRWYAFNRDYIAKFISDDMSHSALFKKNGYLKYDISYGSERNLPEEIRNRVQSTYQDFKIDRVANVKESGRNIWVINLESLRNYVMVRVEEEEMEEVKRVNKSE